MAARDAIAGLKSKSLVSSEERFKGSNDATSVFFSVNGETTRTLLEIGEKALAVAANDTNMQADDTFIVSKFCSDVTIVDFL